MKIVFMTLNSKYIHSNLAIHSIAKYLKTYISDQWKNKVEIIIKEYTINNTPDDTLRDLVELEADLIICSSYIWNIDSLVILFSNYRKLNQKSFIILGGPEVSYNGEEKLQALSFVDLICLGEGEESILKIVTKWLDNRISPDFTEISGIVYRSGNQMIHNCESSLIHNLDQIPFVYDDLSLFENRILYYESSRGCPYNCSYCLSAASKGVRFYSLERVFKDMRYFLEAQVPQVKFVDRTFNVKKEHALGIIQFLIENDNGVTNFHFEITATLLDDDYFEHLKKAREGLFQFEIGVQTTYVPTMEAINRPIDFGVLSKICKRLLQLNNIHVHLDLIAGLPHEDFSRFLESFDDVYNLKPHALQLGFLKLLKGTPIMLQKDMHGYEYRQEAPYEILYNNVISFNELTKLKHIESLVEYYYNSGKFKQSLAYVLKESGLKPHEFYLHLSAYFKEMSHHNSSISTIRLYEILFDYYCKFYKYHELFRDLLKFDYYASNQKGQRTLFHYIESPNFNNRRLEYLRTERFRNQTNQKYDSLTPKQILKTVEFITCNYDIITLINTKFETIRALESVILFDYSQKPHQLEQSKYYAIELPELKTNHF